MVFCVERINLRCFTSLQDAYDPLKRKIVLRENCIDCRNMFIKAEELKSHRRLFLLCTETPQKTITIFLLKTAHSIKTCN